MPSQSHFVGGNRSDHNTRIMTPDFLYQGCVGSLRFHGIDNTRGLSDGTYTFLTLPEKTWKSHNL